MTEFDAERDLAHMHFAAGEFRCRNAIHPDQPLDWCPHIQRMIKAGADADMLHAGQTLTVPIFPTAGIFADVYLGEPFFDTQSCLMELHHAPDIGRPFQVQLGFWNPGEGMGSIRMVILDYLASKLDPFEDFQSGPIKTKCPATTHGMPEMRKMLEGATDKRWKWNCLWSIVMEKACIPCVEMSSSGSGSNFGIDPDALSGSGKKPWQS